MLRFRVKVGDKHHISVHVYDTVKLMHAATKEIHGEPAHPNDCAVTIRPGDVVNGRIAHILLCWKYCQPHILAHEAVHAAFACALILGPGVDSTDESDEKIAQFTENIFRAVNRRVNHG